MQDLLPPLARRRIAAFLIDTFLISLPVALLAFLSSLFLPEEIKEQYYLFIALLLLPLVIVFYYTVQFISSLTNNQTPGQRLTSTRRESPGFLRSFLRFFLFGALPMVLVVYFALWPLLLVAVAISFAAPGRGNLLDKLFSIDFVFQEEKDLYY